MLSVYIALFEQVSARNHQRSVDGKTKYLVRQEDGSFLCIRWRLMTTHLLQHCSKRYVISFWSNQNKV